MERKDVVEINNGRYRTVTTEMILDVFRRNADGLTSIGAYEALGHVNPDTVRGLTSRLMKEGLLRRTGQHIVTSNGKRAAIYVI
jgi:predicted transcriptional regulator of viral defense system